MTARAGRVRRLRLAHQLISTHPIATPAQVVAHLGAVQAQDALGTRWAVGLRLPGDAREADVESALAGRAIVRTHAMRGTWQLIAAADVRWIVGLVGPRVLARAAARHRELGLDAATLRRSEQALGRALADGAPRTRGELAAALSRARVDPAGQRLIHILGWAELELLICGAARRGKQPTWALADRWLPAAGARRTADDARAELARRYFTSRGPASVADFGWWSGLPAGEARDALAAIQGELCSAQVGGATLWWADPPSPAPPAASSVALLPPFDEYLVAYRHRDHVLAPENARRINAGGGMLDACVVAGGEVVGSWKRRLGRTAVTIEVSMFERPTARLRQRVVAAARRYAAYLGRDPDVVLDGRSR